MIDGVRLLIRRACDRQLCLNNQHLPTKMFVRNSILQAALEELQASGVSEESPPTDSTSVVASTDVEPVDAVAALQDKIEDLEDKTNAVQADAIVANGQQVQADLDEVANAAVALENLGNLALATGHAGQATVGFNASIALGIESICTSLSFPSIVAALEAEQPDASAPGKENEAAKSLGERAKDTAKTLAASMIAFLKKIKDWFIAFLGRLSEGLLGTAKIAKDLHNKLGPLKDGVEIKDEAFIKSLGLVSDNADADFKAYGMFSAKVYAMLTNKNMLDGVVRIASATSADEVNNSTQAFFQIMSKSVFTTAAGVEDPNVAYSAASPRLIGGVQYVIETKKFAVNSSNCKITVDTSEDLKTPASIHGPKTSDAREFLNLIVHWSDDAPKLKDSLNALDKATGLVSGNDISFSAGAARAFMTIVTQLVTVLSPSVVNQNTKVARKYIAYCKKALEASTATPAAAAGA